MQLSGAHARRGVVALLAGIACTSGPSAIPPDVARQQVIQEWLTCEECVGGELARVRALGVAAIPELSRSLVRLPDTVLANITRSSQGAFVHARREFNRMTPVERAARPMSDSASFVDGNVSSFRALYQVRSAIALKAIDPVLAKDTLRNALMLDSLTTTTKLFRADVRKKLNSLAYSP